MRIRVQTNAARDFAIMYYITYSASADRVPLYYTCIESV